MVGGGGITGQCRHVGAERSAELNGKDPNAPVAAVTSNRWPGSFKRIRGVNPSEFRRTATATSSTAGSALAGTKLLGVDA